MGVPSGDSVIHWDGEVLIYPPTPFGFFKLDLGKITRQVSYQEYHQEPYYYQSHSSYGSDSNSQEQHAETL